MSRAVALAALAFALLAGCGQKGPLYLPDDERAAERYDGAAQQGEQADDDDDADEDTD